MKSVKKILLISLLLFSFIGIITSINEYAGGYDEVSATVIQTWKSQKKTAPQNNKYTIVWNDLKGKSHRGGNFVNKYQYKEGDEIVIKVDRKTHEHLYAPTPHLIMFIILFVIAILFLIRIIRKERS